jgi:hypothetical protein
MDAYKGVIGASSDLLADYNLNRQTRTIHNRSGVPLSGSKSSFHLRGHVIKHTDVENKFLLIPFLEIRETTQRLTQDCLPPSARTTVTLSYKSRSQDWNKQIHDIIVVPQRKTHLEFFDINIHSFLTVVSEIYVPDEGQNK